MHSATQLNSFSIMKRPRSTAATNSPQPPPTPPKIVLRTRRSKSTNTIVVAAVAAKLSSKKSKTTTIKNTTTTTSTTTTNRTATALSWAPLNLTQSELSLPVTFPTGQTFRWKQTAPLQYTGTLGPHLISLKHKYHNGGDVLYHIHRTPSESAAKSALLDFLNADISLTEIWDRFFSSDTRFAELARHLGGARVLRQDPLECLMQFLCSSNNNIARITKMVDHLSSLGNHLGSVEGFEFYHFPSIDQLALVTEQQLRAGGFGYRAKYITGTVNALRSKPGGGEEWLASLRKLDLKVVIDKLCTLPGVGPKVAACIALFSLDQHHAVPVDTHVWQIATRYLLPELAGARLTPKLCRRVADAFVSKYGKYAGWAQTVLFIAELPSQKDLLPSHFPTIEENEYAHEKDNEAPNGD